MNTRIVILRHAKPLSQGIAEDSLRPLSDEGKITQKKLMEILKGKGIFPTKIFTSPLLRAVQTAEMATEIFGIAYQVEPALGEDFDNETLLTRIKGVEQDGCIFVVGHAPTLEEFIDKLVGQKVLSRGLSKSSAVIIDFEGGATFGKGKFIEYIQACAH